jgi:hypothetical protein
MSDEQCARWLAAFAHVRGQKKRKPRTVVKQQCEEKPASPTPTETGNG